MSDDNNDGGWGGIGLGGILAGLMSWFKWHSVLLALVHAFLCGWIYVFYYLIRYGWPEFLR